MGLLGCRINMHQNDVIIMYHTIRSGVWVRALSVNNACFCEALNLLLEVSIERNWLDLASQLAELAVIGRI